jgi:dUTP pyrophosphatase
MDLMSKFTKETGFKPTLVSTGMKCKLDPGTYLQLSVRSSSPLKYWLMMANSVGIIDADYYNNQDNEGEIFFQIYNLSPFNIKINKGEAIGQGIIMPYGVTEDDVAGGERVGGFGSTSK